MVKYSLGDVMTATDVQVYRNYKVTKANSLIQKTRFSLTLQEQKIILYILTKIQPQDTALTEYSFDIKEFCEICGIDASGMYTNLKEVLKKLSDRSFWAVIDDDGTESLLRWISTARTNKRSGTIKVKIHEDMRPFLLELKKQFTTYSLIYVLGMKSQYSIRIYELLKSYEKIGRWEFDIDDLKLLLMCGNYERYPDFKRKVLDMAKKEINDCSDLLIDFKPVKDGRRFAKIAFTINLKKGYEQSLETMSNIEKAIGKKRGNAK
jgi:plasmid replication initiation protein